jgi:hypothetical protein
VIDPGVARDLASADLEAHWAAVEARAKQLATLPLLAAAVVTDAATIRDLAAEEPTLRAAAPESIELGQIHKDRVVSLFRRPEGAPPAALERTGRHLAIAGTALRFTAVAPIVPSQDAGSMRGAIAVSTAVSPDAAVRRLAARVSGRLVVGGAALDLAGGLPAGAPTTEVGLDGLPGAPRLILPMATIAPPHASTLRVIGTASLAACLVLAAVAIARRRPARSAPSPRRSSQPGQPAQPDEPAHQPARRRRASSQRSRTTMPGVGAQPPPVLVRPTPPRPQSGLATSGLATAAVATDGATTAGFISGDTGSQPGVPGLPRLGRYELLSLLGEGGTASVYLARATDGSATRRFAVKVLHPDLARQDRAREMFFDEARIAARIEHPNVARIFDLGHEGGQHYLAMEHVDGSDLESLLHDLRAEGRRVPLDIAVAILQRLCAGLHAAHLATDEAGRPLRIVHRDVKPGNVLLSRDGAVKVSDFGVAKARQQLHTSLFGETRGTAAFMAPEQRLGHLVDARTDVFGVAAIAYELITGLEIDLDLARLREYGTSGWPHLPSILDVRPEIPPALDRTVFRALAYAQDERHVSCADLAADLAVVAGAAGWDIRDVDLAAWVRDELARRAIAAVAASAEPPASAPTAA